MWGKGHQQKTEPSTRTLEERNPEAEVGVAVGCVCVCVCVHVHSTYTPIPFSKLTRILSVKSALLADDEIFFRVT